jgi:Heparinase II/III-like protein/Heparinase II/III N-terminus
MPRKNRNRLLAIASRIASMQRTEILDRVRQEFQKRSDTISFALGRNPCRGQLRRTGADPGRFFFRSADVPRLMSILRERIPQQVETILETAEKICQHHFDLLGYSDLDYGREIDWHLDRVHGKRASRDPSFKIRYLDFASVGDAKITWELNRHQHLVTLAKAYRLTGDTRYASELIAQFRHWQKENPYLRGINWASSLEVAFRALSWLWVYFLLEKTSAMTPQFRDEWLAAMALSGRHIELYPSTYFSPNTHLLGEAVALLFIGTLCTELRSASRWKQRGWEMVLRESARQVRPDGFYFEQSTYYHVYALDFLLHAGVFTAVNGMSFPPEYYGRLEQMSNTLAVLCRAGTPPRWGDDDGGRVFDPLRNGPDQLSDALATSALLFRRGDFKLLSAGLREETLWLLGEQGVSDFDAIEAKSSGMDSIAFPDAGLYVMSCSERKMQAVIDAGPQGALRGGHGHADALSLTVHAEGQQLLGDPGTCEYVGAEEERDHFRGTASHNTLQMDRQNQSDPQGPFAWDSLTSATAKTWITGQRFDLFIGSHDGYSRLENPATHRRWVFFRKPKFWLVRDEIFGTGTHQLDLRWNLNPELSAAKLGDRPFFASAKNGGISIFSPEGQAWTRIVEPRVWSRVYGMREPSTVVRFTTETILPTEFVTLLAPAGLPRNEAAAHAHLALYSSSTLVKVYRFIDNQEDHIFIFPQQKSWTFDAWHSDAEFVYSCSINGNLNLVALCNGTYLDFGGNRMVSCSKRMLRCELLQSPESAQVICSEDDVLVSQSAIRKAFEAQETAPRESDEAAL